MAKILSQRQKQRAQAQRQHTDLRARVVAHLGYAVLLDFQGRALLADWRRHVGDVACNDLVSISFSGQDAVIESIFPRGQVFSKRQGRRQKIMASHLQQILLVLAIEPEWQENFLDRFWVAAAAQGLPLLLFINKCDLPHDESALRARLQAYAPLEIFYGSVESGQGLEALRQALQGKETMLCGASGVGKSSLVQALNPGAQLWIQALSELSRLGRHTTTNIRRYGHPDGGALIDSAGVRGLHIQDYRPDEILAAYPEIATAAMACRFNDCQHRQEPDCAVLEALRRGEIHALRHRNFLQLMDEVRSEEAP